VVFDGSTQAAQISLPLSGVSDLTMSMWLWWDNYAPTPVGIAFEWPSPYDTGAATGVTFLPNANESTYNFAEASSSQYRGVKASPYPTSGAWHHFGIRYSAAAQTVTVLVDGAAPFTITGGLTGTVASTFAGGVLNLMSRGGTSFFGAGRMAGLAIFDRLLSDAELREHIAATGVAVSDAFDPRIPADPGGGFGDVVDADVVAAGDGGDVGEQREDRFGRGLRVVDGDRCGTPVGVVEGHRHVVVGRQVERVGGGTLEADLGRLAARLERFGVGVVRLARLPRPVVGVVRRAGVGAARPLDGVEGGVDPVAGLHDGTDPEVLSHG
jgi:hypothetical protein